MKFRQQLIVAAAVCVSLTASVPCVAQKTATALATAKQYYPLVKGNRWDFNMSNAGETSKISYRAAAIEEIDGVTMCRIETVEEGNTVASEHISGTDEGLFRHRFNGDEISPPLQLLRNPVKIGDSWSGRINMGGQVVDVKCTVEKTEQLKVTAGEYDTIKLHVSTSVQGIEIVSDYWLAADVGIVKQYIKIGDTEVTMQLAKFTPGEGATRSAKP